MNTETQNSAREDFRQAPGTVAGCQVFATAPCQAEVTYTSQPSSSHRQRSARSWPSRAVRCTFVCLPAPTCMQAVPIFESATRKPLNPPLCRRSFYLSDLKLQCISKTHSFFSLFDKFLTSSPQSFILPPFVNSTFNALSNLLTRFRLRNHQAKFNSDHEDYLEPHTHKFLGNHQAHQHVFILR